MRMPVRTPHATSSPYIGDIRHLGAEIEPIPESCEVSPQRNFVVFAGVRVRGPYCEPLYTRWQEGPRLPVCPKHLTTRYGKEYRLPKSLVEPGATFVIISNHKEINRWRLPPHRRCSPKPRHLS